MEESFEICGESRRLSDVEVVYKLTKNRETSNRVSEILSNSNSVSVEEICQYFTPSRRETALAAIELYKRLIERKSRKAVIKNSRDIYDTMAAYMGDIEVEECWAIYLNHANRIIRRQRMSVGGLDSTLVDARLVFREALKCNAVAIVVCHNHPSGVTRPSMQDDRLTKSLSNVSQAVGIKLLDHVIISSEGYYSYADECRL